MATYNVLEIAAEIFDELNQPSDVSISFISTYIRSNIGQLNDLIGTSLSINTDTLNFDSALSEDQKVILKQLFYIYYTDFLIRNGLGAASFNSVLEISSDGAMVRRTNKNEISKTYMQLRKELKEDLKIMVTTYKINNGSVKAIHGDDYRGPNEATDFPITPRYPRPIMRFRNG